jgi:hypothetical protein
LPRTSREKKRRRPTTWTPTKSELEELARVAPFWYGPDQRPTSSLAAGERPTAEYGRRRREYIRRIKVEVLSRPDLSPALKRFIAEAEGLTEHEIARNIPSGRPHGRPKGVKKKEQPK